MSLYQILATLSYIVLFSGILLRKNRKVHPPFMLVGVISDIVLVLILEFSRGAIETAFSGSVTLFQGVHIVTSSLAVLFYLPTVYYGFLRLKPKPSQKVKKRHKLLGVTAFTFRTIGFIFMFSW